MYNLNKLNKLQKLSLNIVEWHRKTKKFFGIVISTLFPDYYREDKLCKYFKHFKRYKTG